MQFAQYFATAPDWHRLLLLGVSIFILWNVENFSSVKPSYFKRKHAFTNALFMITALPVQLLMGFLLSKVLNFTEMYHFGIINWLPTFKNSFIPFVIAFLLLDFFEYIYHIAMHHTKALWKFHLVHHSDRFVDTSTVLREHPVETFIRLIFLLLWVLLSGVSFWALIARQFIQIVSNVLAHANFRFPNRLERVVGLIFITPNFTTCIIIIKYHIQIVTMAMC
jgi:sterol desaturase/sphingolipid hydroxylase (fatty acid hydroxylase superfamily)